MSATVLDHKLTSLQNQKGDTDSDYFVCCSGRQSQVRFFVIHLIQNATATKPRERLVSLEFDSNLVEMLYGIRNSYAAKQSPYINTWPLMS